MEKKTNAQEYRTKKRQEMTDFSDFIDKNYDSFYKVAEYMDEKNIPNTRIDTPFGDFTILILKK